MQIFFGAPAPFAYPSAPALAAAAPDQTSANPAGSSAIMTPMGFPPGGQNLFGNPFSYAGQASGTAQAQAPNMASTGGHTVVNSTNAMQSGVVQGMQGMQGHTMAPMAGGGGFGGGYLIPAFAAPVMVPSFFVVAVPYAVAAPAAAQSPATVPATQPPVDVVEAAPLAPVVDVAPDIAEPDAAQEAPPSRARTRLFDGRSEVSFALTLTTLEGDTVSIDFRQAASAAQGFTVEADSWDALQRTPDADDEDSFKLTIDGQLNAVERGAIDALMDDVLTLADAFFRGNDGAVTQSLMALNLDGQTMSELALSLSMTQSVEVQRGYGRDVEALDQLRRSGGERLATLDFLASEQKMLIDQAREILDPPSAVRFVRDSLGPLLQGAMDSLNAALADTFAVAATEEDVDDAAVVSAAARDVWQPAPDSDEPVGAEAISRRSVA